MSTDKQFRQYLKQANILDKQISGLQVGGMAHYVYNRWTWRGTVLLVVLAYVSLC